MKHLKRYLLLFSATFILNACSYKKDNSEVTSSNKTTDEITVDIAETDEEEEIEVPKFDTERYPQDWENIKAAILSGDEVEVGIHCAGYGVDKPQLLKFTNQEFVKSALSNSTFEDLVPDKKGDITYLKFYAEHPNDASKNISIYLKQGFALIIEYYIVME